MEMDDLKFKKKVSRADTIKTDRSKPDLRMTPMIEKA